MTRGIYSAATGMLAEESAQQVIAQNLANASTTGYKQDIPTFKSFDETLVSIADDSGATSGTIGAMGHGGTLDKVYTDLSDGSLQQTGNNLDVALRGSAFLAVQTLNGIDYSRDGAMTMNSKGTLVQVSTGLPILDDKQRTIQIPQGSSIHIGQDGELDVDGKSVANLGLFSITNADNPTKIGDNLLTVSSTPKTIDASSSSMGSVEAGYLESSNVSIVKEMVTMISCLRSYEANQKVLQAHDEMQNQAVSDVGKVS